MNKLKNLSYQNLDTNWWGKVQNCNFNISVNHFVHEIVFLQQFNCSFINVKQIDNNDIFFKVFLKLKTKLEHISLVNFRCVVETTGVWL